MSMFKKLYIIITSHIKCDHMTQDYKCQILPGMYFNAHECEDPNFIELELECNNDPTLTFTLEEVCSYTLEEE